MFRWLVIVLSFNGVRWPYLLYSLLRRSVGKTDNYSAIYLIVADKWNGALT
jgi:hypothetical protein